MPYNVTLEEALKHEEVESRLASSITKLKQVTTMFLATIVKARPKLPYGIQYMAKVLFYTLKHRCPNVPDKELLKVVGNLVYYRYINSAIGMSMIEIVIPVFKNPTFIPHSVEISEFFYHSYFT